MIRNNIVFSLIALAGCAYAEQAPTKEVIIAAVTQESQENSFVDKLTNRTIAASKLFGAMCGIVLLTSTIFALATRRGNPKPGGPDEPWPAKQLAQVIPNAVDRFQMFVLCTPACVYTAYRLARTMPKSARVLYNGR